MLYDRLGKPIDESTDKVQLVAGQSVFSEDSDRYSGNASRSLTPEKVDSIMTAATQGNIAQQSQLALDLSEKNWEIAHALGTRQNAALGKPWTVEPGDDTPAAKKAAEDLKKALDAAGGPLNTVEGKKLDTFKNLRADLLTALMPGFAVSENIWKPGGQIGGFRFISQRHFDLTSGNLRLMITGIPEGVELKPRKFIVNSYRRQGSDIARSGLIRTLAWLHCFMSLPFKDLLRFVERYGMPFLMLKVDKDSWDNERNKLKNLIRNFGPDGGALVTRAIEAELIEAANSNGEVFFRLVDLAAAAITKVVLGQTASSQDTPGKLGNDDAKKEVRQDYLEADCGNLDDTLYSDLCIPWNMFNSPAGTAAPRIKTHCKPATDIKSLSETAKTFYEAGYDTDPDEMSAKAGFKLTRRVVAPVTPPMTAQDNLPLSAESLQSSAAARQPGIEKWAAPLVTRLNTALESDEGFERVFGGAMSSGFGFEDFNGAILEDFLGTSTVLAAAQGKADAAEKIKEKLKAVR